MEKSLFKRINAVIVGILGLLIIPIIIEVPNLTFYIIGALIIFALIVIRVILDKKFDEYFFNRWTKAREKGFWLTVLWEGIRLLCIVTMVVCISQFLVYGRTPFWIVTVLPTSVLIGLILFFIGLYFVGGIASWFENEKKYERMKSIKEQQKAK